MMHRRWPLIVSVAPLLAFLANGLPLPSTTNPVGMPGAFAQSADQNLAEALAALQIDGRWVGGRHRQPQYSIEFTGPVASILPLSDRIRPRTTPPVTTRDQTVPIFYQVIAVDGPIITLSQQDSDNPPVHLLFWSSGSAIIWQAGDREVGFASRVAPMPEDLLGEWNCLEVSQGHPARGRYRIVIGESAFSIETDGRIEVLHPIPLQDCGENVELAVVPSRARPYSVIVHRHSPQLLLWETAQEGDPDRSSFLFLFRGERPAWLESYLTNADVGALQRRSAMRDEVTQNIRRIFDASARYFQEGGQDAAGRTIRHQFPPPTPRTPSQVPCVAVEPDPGLWGADTWMALNFAIWDPFYFSYQYDSSGQGNSASFTISAYGDIDCDGVYSTFTQTGTVTEDLEVVPGELLVLNPEE